MTLLARSAQVVAWAAAGLVVTATAAAALGPVELDERPAALRISGHVAGLAPGLDAPLELVVRNPGDAPAPLHRLHVAVRSSDAQGCPSAVLRVPDWTGSVVVPAGGEVAQRLVATLDPAAPDACQAATWTLDYTAS